MLKVPTLIPQTYIYRYYNIDPKRAVNMFKNMFEKALKQVKRSTMLFGFLFTFFWFSFHRTGLSLFSPLFWNIFYAPKLDLFWKIDKITTGAFCICLLNFRPNVKAKKFMWTIKLDLALRWMFFLMYVFLDPLSYLSIWIDSKLVCMVSL